MDGEKVTTSPACDPSDCYSDRAGLRSIMLTSAKGAITLTDRRIHLTRNHCLGEGIDGVKGNMNALMLINMMRKIISAIRYLEVEISGSV